tara:strand:- start:899 stop:1144 length:246 start_codon:yes stop_codon:yes gene_type:complete
MKNEDEYSETMHRIREMIGMLIEDGCDAVVLSWSRTEKGTTVCDYETFGNFFACNGLAHDTFTRLVQGQSPTAEVREEDEE